MRVGRARATGGGGIRRTPPPMHDAVRGSGWLPGLYTSAAEHTVQSREELCAFVGENADLCPRGTVVRGRAVGTATTKHPQINPMPL